MPLDPKRTIAELKELRALTGDANGAQRVAWTDTWLKAREWFAGKLAGLPVEHRYDAAGNNWATLPGASEKALLIGGHLDSVPNGGWLDGALNVLAALEILRRINEEFHGRPPVTDPRGRLGGRRRRALRAQPAGLVRLCGNSDGCRRPPSHRSRRRPHGRSPSPVRRRDGSLPGSHARAEKRCGLYRVAHRAGPSARTHEPAAGCSAGHQGSRAARHHVPWTGSALRLDSHERPPRRARRLRQTRPRNSRHRWQASRCGVHDGQRQDVPRYRHGSGRPLRSYARPARP